MEAETSTPAGSNLAFMEAEASAHVDSNLSFVTLCETSAHSRREDVKPEVSRGRDKETWETASRTFLCYLVQIQLYPFHKSCLKMQNKDVDDIVEPATVSPYNCANLEFRFQVENFTVPRNSST